MDCLNCARLRLKRFQYGDYGESCRRGWLLYRWHPCRLLRAQMLATYVISGGAGIKGMALVGFCGPPVIYALFETLARKSRRGRQRYKTDYQPYSFAALSRRAM